MEALKLNLLEQSGIDIQSPYYRNLPSHNFVQFALIYIETYRKGGKDYAAFRNYIHHFIEFQNEIGRMFETKDISCDVLKQFVRHLERKNLKKTTIQNIVLKIKTLIKKAYNNGWAVDYSYQDFRVACEDLTFIYLDDKELPRIFYFDGLTKSEKEIRDLFIVGCYTGLRYSDYSRLTRANFRNGFIEITTRKTRTKVCLPIPRFVKEIYERYGYSLPKARCIQYFNKAIKTICRKVGLTERIIFDREIGGEIITFEKDKCDLVTSHTARRSFATNMLLEGQSEVDIMKLTGHRSMQCFAKYISTTRIENASRMGNTRFLRA